VDGNCQDAYGVDPDSLNRINEDKDVKGVQSLGDAEGLAKALKTDLKNGLDPNAAGAGSIESHREVFGPNTFAEVPPKSFFALVFENLRDPIIMLLIFAALVSTIFGLSLEEERENNGWIEGVAIWAAVSVVALVGAANDYQKDQQFRKLNEQKEVFDVTVFRGGDEMLVKNPELVAGDILVLNTGDRVTADGIAFESHDLVIDEASLTGESEPIKKNPDKDFWCRSGTQVTEGTGKVLVIAVGQNSEWGRTLALVAGDSDETPLQEKLGELAAAVGKLGLVVAVLSFTILIVRWMIEQNGFPISKINQDGPIQFFLFAVTIVVVAVPEGLPLAVTISLAYSMKKMMKDNNFVRVLAACETMGGATAICSDKTGTLTENRMTVIAGWFQNVKYPQATPEGSALNPDVKRELEMNIALNSNAFLIEEENKNIQFVGNRTECALLMLGKQWGSDYKKLRSTYQKDVAKIYGFSSIKKMASILLQREDVLRLYNKGASEIVVERCVSYFDENGVITSLNPSKKEEILQYVTEMAARGLRTIGLAYTDFPSEDPSRPETFFDNAPDNNLTLMAVVGIKDPVRKEVPDAVLTCQKAGINVRMVTGDNIHTARHIARECGILTESGISLEGPAFRELSEDEMIKVLPKLQVLARSSPTDKHTLVSMLRKLGEVVAVTGDGTNDAPALKESDVGLAMGIAGTEVAKEAADIVILDDNFLSIVKSVLWGRSVFNNIRKFLQFQLTINFVALILAFVAALVGGETPLNVLQLLWVNLIMDTMAALALATEYPTWDLLDQKPSGREEPLINKKMWKHIIIGGLYQLFWMLLLLYGLPVSFERYEKVEKDEFFYNYCSERSAEGDTFTENGETDTFQNLCFDPNLETRVLICSPNEPGQVQGECSENKDLDRQGIRDAFFDEIQEEYEDEDKAHFRKVSSVIFNAFIFMQIFNEINSRKIDDEYNIFEGVFSSQIYIGVITVTAATQVIIMETPLGDFFLVDPLVWYEWLVSIVIGLGIIPLSLLVRFISRNWCGGQPNPDLDKMTSSARKAEV